MGRKTLILEQILHGEKPVTEYTDGDAFARMGELEDSNKEILARYPAEKVLPDVKRKLEKEETGDSTENQSPKKTSFMVLKFVSVAAVLCLALLIPFYITSKGRDLRNIENIRKAENYVSKVGPEQAAPGMVQEDEAGGIGLQESVSADRVKGGANFFIYKKIGDEAARLSNNSFVQAGDLLQLTYVASGATFGVILSIDGNGAVTQHLPEYGINAAMLNNEGGEIPLSFSYSLDDAPYFERFIFVTSDEFFTIEGILKAVNAATDKKECGTMDFSPYLPKDAFIKNILLKK